MGLNVKALVSAIRLEAELSGFTFAKVGSALAADGIGLVESLLQHKKGFDVTDFDPKD